MIVNVELRIEVTGNVTEEEVADFSIANVEDTVVLSTIHY